MFIIGNEVKVKSRETVSRSLDPSNKREGCLFMDQMWEYCGLNFKVKIIVYNFFDEYRFKMYKPQSPLYILDDLICHGEVSSFEHRCDRSCFLMWHEDWLEEA